MDSRCAPAHKLHKANSRNKPKRTNDVLPKPVKSECYRQSKSNSSALMPGSGEKLIGCWPMKIQICALSHFRIGCKNKAKNPYRLVGFANCAIDDIKGI